ncbi:MAG: SulP family inorganic anion transporter [Burkholderiales bacterium]|nr:SulP family inorganic anion transporter [Burkholderiales bacterium]
MRRAGRRAPSSGAPWSFPPPWVRSWQREGLAGDVSAGLVVAIMLVPQSLAYALLAGLPPQVGLMASLLPVLGYAAFGSSGALSVGPAAITSLMVAQALTPLAAPGSAAYGALAALLALGSGLLLMLMGRLRLGFLSQLLSRPVVQGFTVASALLIMAGQVAPLLGWQPGARGALDTLRVWRDHLSWQDGWPHLQLQSGDAVIGVGALVLLWVGPKWLTWLARVLGWRDSVIQIAGRLWPLAVLVLTSVGAFWLKGADLGPSLGHFFGPVALVGAVSVQLDGATQSLALAWQQPWAAWSDLLMPVLLISLLTFVSSMSVAQTFALQHGERIDADRELLGLGLANVGSAVLGGLAVSGGLSRSVVNDAAGARTPLAGVITAVILAALLFACLPWLAYLPKAALAALIIMAGVGLVQFAPLRDAWRYDRADAWAFISTALGVMLMGFEAGILLGIAWSLGAMIWRHSQPHMAEVGRLPGTEHFRNVQRYEVEQLDSILMVRVDESLDFTNIQRVELRLCELIHARGHIERIVLLLSAVNHIDHSAMQTLLELDAALADQGKTLYLAEVKGPVMDRLQSCRIDKRFEGRIFMSAQHAWDALV